MTDLIKPKTRRIMLEAGRLVMLRSADAARDFPRVVPIDRVAEGVHWFLGSIAPLERGAKLTVEYALPNDARYATQARVLACSPGAFGLKIDRTWERLQERAFVRVAAHAFQVRVVRLALPDSGGSVPGLVDEVFDLVDVSAGGVRFLCEDGFEADEEVVCHFELPNSFCFVLPGRVVRPAETLAVSDGKPSVAVEFEGLDDHNRSELLRWVYREQLRRHKEGGRRPDR